jgi:glycerophosphoryl diester phosphodiesterase
MPSRPGAGKTDAALPERGVGAHRGGAAHRPENTLAAFREAVRLGAQMVELDLRRSGDGAIVVMHDATVDRTTDGCGAVSDLSLAELRRLDAGRHFGPAYRGERVPSLEEVLDVLPRHVWLNLQIKRGEPIAAEVTRSLVRAGRLDQAFLACGDSAGREARAAHPDVLLCNLVRQGSRDAYIEHAAASGSRFVQLHFLRGLPEVEQVERAHAAGLRVTFFCDPQGRHVEELFERGVDFVLVDDVVAALECAAKLFPNPVRLRVG